MKQIIPFNKEIVFKTEDALITSISLNHDLKLKGEDLITGNFYIKGKYKITKASLTEEEYSYKIPCDIAISDDYDTFDSTIDIDDFYYEFKEGKLNVHIAVVIDNLTKKEKVEPLRMNEDLIEESLDAIESNEEELLTKRCIEDEDVDIKIENLDNDEESKINVVVDNKNVNIITEEKRENPVDILKQGNEDLFKELNNYSTYCVYLTKEEDTFSSIIDKYKVSKEELLDYNDITDITPGLKLIIPETKNG